MKNNLLIVNVYFAPKSFGGATIVAEQLAFRLHKKYNLTILTTIQDEQYPPYSSIKYFIKDIEVIAINLPSYLDKLDIYKHDKFAIEFSKYLKIIKPNLVHFHSIQTMGAEMLEATKISNIPFVVTVHDNWWICERQFMINNYEKYCWQKKIDLEICKECTMQLDTAIGEYGSIKYRFNYLLSKLKQSDIILFPSQFQLNLYKENLSSSNNLFVNKNGIKEPSIGFKRFSSKKIRFGFVGGNGHNKGLNLILKAFAEITATNYELVIVDNTLNLGFSSIKIDKKKFKGDLSIVKSYTQDTMDDFFANIDVLLFPSQLKESFGLTVREALIRDIFVILTDSGGTVEDIVDGENGIIIPLDGDYKKLQIAILDTLKRDFSNYTNHYKEKITTYNDQAEELDIYYQKILKEKKEN